MVRRGRGGERGRQERAAPPPPTRGSASPPAAIPLHSSAPHRPALPGDGGLDDFLCRAEEAAERSHHKAKRHAAQEPAFRGEPCICGCGPCDVVWATYVCSATRKCSHFAWCEESDLNPNSQPAFGCHPEPSNPRAFNTPSNHGAGASTPVNVSPQGAGIRLLVNASPQGAGATTSVNVRSNGKWPICKCTAGKTVNVVDFCVCPTPKGQGSCLYPERWELVNAAAAEEPPQTGNNNTREKDENGLVNPDQPEDDEWPFDIVDGDIVPKGCLPPAQPAPTRSPMPLPPHGTASHVTPRSNCCFRCGEEGHWYNKCPKPPPPCYRCKEAGHRSKDCPKFSPQLDICFHCGEVGHWKNCCPVLRDERGL